MNTAMETIRLNITVPAEVLREVKQSTEKRGVSRFITEALVEKLDRVKRSKALKKMQTLPPAFPYITDSASYIRKIRKTDEKRMKRIGV
ncbi:hypothetical protein A3D78_05165 [Candidatus Gottesmanbacteria bacterium RIFCSPHIGHO2_02_FULL_39_14]|uniref:Ribbon-helix-helix protein CopG domain-containing protein n=3 Tax=Candidatus Gottesmaniibacteriota TaxID=1752720 RepID=A0A1F5ZZ42_9BACT|nr:MAG: hypothetical protein A2153_02140 [Candidatus Gottesmanbacteria bacterium RBG_16_38_7b]OGG17614.1 MAG: hypothetical protein A3D78_05165 [Candidatus Gottesmanbacteria bacterium RIFCSPHIGHO2_02_FULL_39_14]OGG32452.1 MAG: hypothetical protein A3I51_05160 [Candidatus Gottesmanbacteria bacterium RIFCSPLOWO2_02_FULL_38_8]